MVIIVIPIIPIIEMGSSIRRFTKISLTLFLLTVSLRLSAQVTASFSIVAPVPNCNPAVYSFVNSSTGTPPLSYQWNFGVYPGINSVFPNPSTTYIGCGTFTVQLIVTDGTGAVDTTTMDVTVQCSPSANFTTGALTGCIPFNAGLNSTSTPGSGTIADYLWDFGDGFTGGGANPNHTYTQTGCKNVTLIVTNSFNCSNDTTITNVLCTYNPPVAGFTSSNPTSCSAPFSVTYQDTSGSGLPPYTQQWIFEGGTPATSDSANPTVTYNAAGNFTTTEITTDADGCTDTIVKSSYINIANNTADFTLSAVNGCAPATISASGISSSTPLGWNWTVTPSATIAHPTSQNTSFTFADTGTYTICLTIDYGNGCTAQKCSTVVIHAAPVANFGIAGLLNTCIKPNQIVFNDSSTGSNLTYNWAFPGGSPASADSSSPPPVTYSSCGNYSATLTVSDDFGCTATHAAANFLTITCPVAMFTVAPRGGCIPLAAQFNSEASTGNPTSWLWDFGDPSSGSADTSSLQKPSHTYATPGCYTVSLTTTNAQGCTASYTLPQAVCTGNKPTAGFTPDPAVNCANMPFNFTNTSTGVDSTSIYTWDFTHTPPGFNDDSHQADPNYIYEDTGYFNVSLIISNYGCNDTLVRDSVVKVLPPVAVPLVERSCSNHFVVTLTGTTSMGADSYLWNIPGGNPSTATTPTVSVTYTSTGNYTASLFVVNDSTGCNDLESVSVPIRNVQAGFTGNPLSGCAPLSTCMLNSSVDAVSYSWFLTNSSGGLVFSSASTNPCFDITAAGVYSMKLIATDMFGCKDTLYRPDYITVYKPAANFIGAPLDGCVPLNVDFTDMSSAVTSTVTAWSWNFGDPLSGVNNTSTLQNPSHTYNQDGFYTVTLTVTDNHGCTNTIIRTNYVHANQPHAVFTAASTVICKGTQECFNNASTGTGLSYTWNFGDGGASTATNPCHLYDSTGTFNISLYVIDATGCKDSAVKTDYIEVTMPHAGFAADTTNTSCPPLQVQFSNLSSDTDAHTTYFWEFGDGQVSSAPDPKHIYNIAGNFTVTLIVTNQNGCKDTLSFPNYIHIGGPTAYISVPPTSGCVPHNTCFQAVSPSSVSFIWNFGDGTVQPGSDSICYTYTRTGDFFPELILNDGVGCIYAMPVGEINIGGAVANFTMDNSSLCNDGTVHFADSSFGTSAVATYAWNFGDSASGASNVSSLKNPAHFYASSGTYTVTLNITTVDSCTNSISKTVTVLPAPSVAFSSSDSSVCPPDSIFFTDLTTSASPIISRLWDFGDTASGTADTSSLPNPSHYYTTAGTFNVILTELAADGCSDNATLPIVVHSAVTANAVSPVAVCIGGSMLLSASGGSNYSWTPATGLNNTTSANPIASPTVTTTYTVTVTSVYGCTGMDSVVVYVNPIPVISSITATADTCGVHGAVATITVNGGTPAYAYSWNTSPTQTDSIATGLAGGSTYTVVVTDVNGCTAVNNIPIVNLPAPVVSIIGTPTTCGYSNGSVLASVTATNLPYTYNWADGSTTQGLSNIAAGNYFITVTDNFGCTGTASKTINNIAGPTVVPNSTNATCGIDNGRVNLTTSGGTHPFTYIWSNGATTKNISNLTGGTYFVTITDANGCTTITGDSLVVIPPPVLSYTKIDATCGKFNGSINATITGGTAPYLFNWNSGAYTTENLTNIHSGNYHVVMTDANGCTDMATVVIGDTPFPILAFAFTPSTCNQSNGAIDLAVSNGVPPYTYNWNTGATTEDISAIPSGSYHIIVNSANGCFADTIVSLNDLTGAALSVTPRNNTCGLVNGAIKLNLTGGTSPFAFNWSNGATTQNISALNTGLYLVTVTDGNGCQTQSNATLVNIPGPTLTSYPARATCGLPNGSINLVLSNGTAPFIYKWSNGATTQNITNVLSGQYAVTVTDVNVCMDSSSAIITNVDGPTLNGTTSSSTCGNANGSVNLTVNSGTAPFTFSWNSGAFSTQDLTNVLAGNYDVLVTDSNLCVATLNLTVSNIPGASLSLSETNTTCGNSNGSINLTLGGGTSPFTYNWNNGAYSTQNITNLAIGMYTVAVTDSNNCVSVDSIAVNNTPGPTLDTVITNASCGNSNGIIKLTISGGITPYSFNWNNGDSTQAISGLAPGLYNATVTDGNGCQASISAIVSNIIGPFSVAGSVSSVCGNSNGSVNLTVTGGTSPFSFNWSNKATGQNVAGLSAGTYYVTITDANGCQITDSSIINNISGPTVSTSIVNSSCGNANGQVYSIVSGGTSPFNYQWSTGNSTANLNYINAGTYNLTVTDGNGCFGTTSAIVSTINGPSALIITATQSTCGNDNAYASATVSGGVPPYQYNWNTVPAQNTDTAINLSGGNTYSLIVTDANNCTLSNSVNITNIAGPTLTNTHANCTCAKINGAINLTVTGGTFPYSYNWSNGATTEDLTGLSPAIYTVTVTDANGCNDTMIVDVINIYGPYTSHTSTNTTCGNNNGTINETISGGTFPFFFDWNSGAYSSGDLDSITAGKYVLEMTDAAGCSVSDSVTITNTPGPSLIMSSVTGTCGNNNGSALVKLSGGTAPFTYLWNNATAATDSFINSLAIGTYTVAVTDSNGCVATDSVAVTNTPGPTVVATANSATCGLNNGSINLTITGGTSPFTYSWNGGLYTTQNISGLAPGTYFSVVTDSNGCEAFTANVLHASAPAALSITSNNATCGLNNGFVTATPSGGTAPYTYSWNNGATTSTISNLSSGIYVLQFTEASGCVQTDSVTLTSSNGSPVVTVVPAQPIICTGGSTSITANGASSYTWSPSTGLSATTGAIVIAHPAVATTYTVIGSVTGGCTDTATVVINIQGPPTVLAVAANPSVCSGTPTTLTASGANTYKWSPAATLSSSTGSVVTSKPTVNITYTVTGTDNIGCTAKTTVSLTSLANPVIQVAPDNPILCNGNSVLMTATGTTNYTWSPAFGLSQTTGASVTADPTVTTTYTIIGTNAQSCADTALEIISAANAAPVNAGPGDTICIGGSYQLQGSGAVQYQWSPATGLSDVTSANPIASPTVTTTYYLHGYVPTGQLITNGDFSAGNTGFSSGYTYATDLVPEGLYWVGPSPNTVHPNFFCADHTTGSGNLMAVNGAPNAGVSIWCESINVVPNSLYDFSTWLETISPAGNPALLQFSINGAPLGSPFSASATMCDWEQFSATWNSGSNTTADICIVNRNTVRNGNDFALDDISFSVLCDSYDSVVVVVNPAPVITVNASNNSICTGSSSTLTASGANTYTWQPAIGLSATTGASVTANPTVTTTYTITAISASGCTGNTTFVLTVSPNPSITINSSTPSFCSGGNSTLTASGANTYSWTPAAGLNTTSGATVTATNTATTTYIVTGTDVNGCSGNANSVVIVRPLPVVSANSVTVCGGNAATLVAIGATTYNWAPNSNINSVTGDSIVASPTTTTTYTVTGTDGFGCSSTATSVVTVKPTPVVDLEGLGGNVCFSSSPVSLSVLPVGGVFSGPGLSGSTFYPDSAGVGGPDTITYSYTNTFGCSASAYLTVTVLANPNLVIATNTPVICPGNTAILAVSGAHFYNWFPVGSVFGHGDSMAVTPSSTTMYFVRGMDTLGCIAMDSTLIRVNAIPVVSISGLQPAYCANSPVDTLTGIPAGGTFSGAGMSGDVFNPSLAGPGVHTIYYVYADSIGCGGEDSVQVTVNNIPVVTASSTSICTGASATLTASGAISYTWMPGSFSGSSITINPATNTTYTVTGTSANTCANTATSVVTVNPLPVVSFSGLNPNYCSAASLVTLTGSPAGGTFIGTGVSGNTFNPASVSIGKPDTITYSFTDSLGCANSSNQIVNIHNGATITASAVSPTICPSTSTVLNASGGVSYTWSPASGLSATTGSAVTANPSINSTYIVSGTDANGCTGSDTITVSIRSNLIIQVSAAANAICKGLYTTITASGATQYSWLPSTGLSSTTGTSVTATPLTTTTYTISGSIAAGCAGDTTLVITVNNPPTITVNSPAICAGSTTTLISGGASSYLWLPNNLSGNSINVSPVANSTYTIIGTDVNGCSNTTNAIVTVNPLPVVSFSGLNPNYCSAASPVTLVGNPAGGVFSGAGMSGNIFSPATLPIGIPDTITYSYTNTHGCTNTASQQTIVNNGAAVTASPATGNICSGSSTGLSASGAVRYAWAPPTGLNIDTGEQVLARPSVSTTYTVTGTDANGCTGRAFAAVVLNGNLSLTITPGNPAICAGSTTTLTASGATNYAWTPNTGLSTTTGASISVSPANTTTYIITGMDAGGCSGSSVAVITVNALPVISATSNLHTVCYNSTASLSASGATNYLWAPVNSLSTSTGNNVIAKPIVNTTYTITGTNAAGCSASDTVSVKVNPPLALVISKPNASVCFGNSVTLNVSGASTYKWSPRIAINTSTGPTVIAAPEFNITYTITATDANGCTAVSNAGVVVNQLPAISAFSSSSSVCVGNTDTLNAVGALTYSWTPSKGLNSVTGSQVISNPLSSIAYTVTGVDTNGCSNSAQLPVTINPLPVVIINPTNPILCGGNALSLSASGNAVNYYWVPATGLSASTGSTVQATPTATSTYTIIGTDTNGCSGAATTLVTVGTGIKLSVSPSRPNVCAGQSSVLTASGAVYYTWAPAVGLNTTTGSVVTASPDSSTIYLLTGTNGTGCMDSISFPVVIRANPIAVAGPDATICSGSGTTLNASGGGSYLWSPSASLSDANISNPYANPSQTTVYIVEVTNNDGCHASDTVVVYVRNKPYANAGNDTLVCLGGSAILHGEEGTSYSWTPKDFLNDSRSSSPICVPTRNITYTLTVTDSFGCSNEDSVQIFVKLPFDIKASPGASICYGGVVQLEATGGFTYQWSPPAGLDNPYVADPEASPAVTTTYTVTSSDGVCFSASDTVVVTVNQLPYLDASLSAEVTYGQNIQLQAYGAGDLSWSPPDFLTCTDCADPYVEHLSHSMTYVVTETDGSGCRVEDTVHISLACGDDGLYVPDAFTPNGDNKNDVFRVRAYGMQHISYFRVFNRWGEMVFETTDINQGWDGTYKGQLCAPAVFDWYLEGTCSNGQEVMKKGNVTLIR